MCLPFLLPCCAVAGYKANKTADKLFGDKGKPQEPSEPAFVTEAKLKWNLATSKKQPGAEEGAAAGGSKKAGPKRGERYSAKELASKERLAQLVESHKSGSFKAPAQQASAKR